MRIAITFLLLSLAMSACQTTQAPLPTPVERIFQSDMTTVKAALASAAIADGFQIVQSNDIQLVAEKESAITNFEVYFYQCGRCSQPLEQVRFTLLPDQAGIKVHVDSTLIINPRSGLERQVTSLSILMEHQRARLDALVVKPVRPRS